MEDQRRVWLHETPVGKVRHRSLGESSEPLSHPGWQGSREKLIPEILMHPAGGRPPLALVLAGGLIASIGVVGRGR